MGRKWRTAAAVGCLAGMLMSLAPSMAQQPSAGPSPANAKVQAPPSTGGTSAQPVAARTQPNGRGAGPEEVDAGEVVLGGNHIVNLDSEGNVSGRVSLLDPRTGLPTPVNGTVVSFVQNGRLVTQVRPGSDGTFSVRLRPGVYSVVAQAPAGFGAFAVVVQPFDPTASDPQELTLDGTLIPRADLQAANVPMGLPLPAPGGAPGGPIGGGGGFIGGGGGGGTGGEGLGSLMGLAGLLGLAALADDEEAAVVAQPVSPAAP